MFFARFRSLVGLSEGLHRNYWTDFHRTWMEKRTHLILVKWQRKGQIQGFLSLIYLHYDIGIEFFIISQGIMHRSWWNKSGVFKWLISLDIGLGLTQSKLTLHMLSSNYDKEGSQESLNLKQCMLGHLLICSSCIFRNLIFYWCIQFSRGPPAAVFQRVSVQPVKPKSYSYKLLKTLSKH